MNAPRKNRVDVHGWIVLDKPVGMTSTHAVAAVRRILNAKKAGHAGTLDPLASGILPLAFGEATKTVPYVVDGEKAYTFTVQWGIETDTDDSEGRAVATSDLRPTGRGIEAALPRFTGIVVQVPPRYSAIKIDGERAYDLARDGEVVELQRPRRSRSTRCASWRTTPTPRPSRPSAARAPMCAPSPATSAARWAASATSRRCGAPASGRSRSTTPITFADLEAAPEAAHEALLSVEGGLTELPCVVAHRDAAARLRRGQSVILRGRDAPAEGGPVYAACGGVVIAVGMVERGELVPNRVFNLDF